MMTSCFQNHVIEIEIDKLTKNLGLTRTGQFVDRAVGGSLVMNGIIRQF